MFSSTQIVSGWGGHLLTIGEFIMTTPNRKPVAPAASTISACRQFDQSFATLYRKKSGKLQRRSHILADVFMVAAWFALIPVINLLGTAAGLA